MNVSYWTTPRLEDLRKRVREWLDRELPPEYEGFRWDFEERDEQWAFYREFWRKLGAQGWIAPTWPKRYGGLEYSRREAAIVDEELDRRGAGRLAGIGEAVGPILLRLGTEAQKERFLPGMAAGEILWAEGYTEPGAGSDLASLRTKAEWDGEHWRITGQKTFCTGAHHCNWIIIAARTDPKAARKQDGISFFLAPLDDPRITLYPLHNIADGRQNQIFLDGVKVPHDQLVGELNRGWQQVWLKQGGAAIPEFPFVDPGPETEYQPEPTGPGKILQRLVDYCRDTTIDGRPRIADPQIRARLVQMAIETEALRLIEHDAAPPYGPALYQAMEREHRAAFAQACMEILGPTGLIQDGELAPLAGDIDRLYRRSFGNHAGGTSQIKRLLIARALGLPR